MSPTSINIAIFGLTLILRIVNSSDIKFVDSNYVLHSLTDVNQIKTIEDWTALAQYDNTINSTGYCITTIVVHNYCQIWHTYHYNFQLGSTGNSIEQRSR